jgi:8-oxo-dGTP pyrophosphatase MutT (NUDIX family)
MVEALPPYVCCILLRQEDSHVLLESRGPDASVAAGSLTCFGGKREASESPEGALLRELREELGWAPTGAVRRCIDLYVDGALTAFFYEAAAPTAAEMLAARQEAGRGHAWLPLARAGAAGSGVSAWHRCVFAARARGAARAEFFSPPPPPPPAALRAATRAELPLVRARWHALWGEGQSLPQLLAEEAALDAHPYAPRRAHLVMDCGGGGAPDGAAFSASCEVHRVPVAFRGGGAPPPADAWLLACVFVPEALRGRGAGCALVRAVASAAAAAGAPALWLFSDIGAPFYEALGFRVAGGGAAFDVVLPPAPRREGGARVEDVALGAPLPAPPLAAPPAAGGCALRLERARAEWLLHAQALRAAAGALPPPPPCAGARCGRAQALWRVARAPDASGEAELVVLHVSGSGEEAAAVLRRAQAAAAEGGLARVRIWDAAGEGLEALVEGGERVPRVGRLPMVLPLVGDPALHTAAVIERGCWY